MFVYMYNIVLYMCVCSVVEEIDDVLGDKEEISYDDLDKLTYLQQASDQGSVNILWCVLWLESRLVCVCLLILLGFRRVASPLASNYLFRQIA